MKLLEVLNKFNSIVQNDSSIVNIAKVVKVNSSTVDCQLVINNKNIDPPVLKNVQIINLNGGTSSIIMPISIGDYCLLFTNHSSVENWLNGFDNKKPVLERKNNLSDVFALIGVKNNNNQLLISNITTINNDVLANGNLKINGNLTINGNANIVGDLSANNVVFSSLIVGGRTI